MHTIMLISRASDCCVQNEEEISIFPKYLYQPHLILTKVTKTSPFLYFDISCEHCSWPVSAWFFFAIVIKELVILFHLEKATKSQKSLDFTNTQSDRYRNVNVIFTLLKCSTNKITQRARYVIVCKVSRVPSKQLKAFFTTFMFMVSPASEKNKQK